VSHRLEDAVTGEPHAPGVWCAIRSLLPLLARDDSMTDADWEAVLRAAVAGVPGAEAGSLNVREGGKFRVRAQLGFGAGILGLALPVQASVVWHGLGEDEWRAGVPSVLRAEDIQARSFAATSDAPEQRSLYRTTGRALELRSTLCVPVPLRGEVVAHLNLDSLSREDAFGRDAVDAAVEFVALVAGLLAARDRRAREARRVLELEALVELGVALRAADSPATAEEVLVRQARRALHADRAVFLRYDAGRGELRCSAFAGTAGAPASVEVACEALKSRRVVAPVSRADGVSQLAVPLHTQGGMALGVLVAERSADRTFTTLEARVALGMAGIGEESLARMDATGALERRAAELEASVTRFRALAQLSLALERAHTPDEVAARALEVLSDVADIKALVLWHVEAQDVRPVAFYGDLSAALREAMLSGVGRQVGLAWNGRAPRPVYLECTDIAEYHELGVRSVALLPLPAREEHAVVLAAYRRGEARSWTAAERAMLETAAHSISLSLERSLHVQQLEATREGAMLALGLTLEARDFETHGHTQRVVRLAIELGRRLGLGAEALEALRQGAYLHDVGKISIPDAILLKPGRLSATERTLMQSHAPQGYALAWNIPTLPRGALDVIRSHHERWDGSGYPDRLAGEDIPLMARIFAVVDVYDALTSDRPYKRAWTREQALREIREQAGRQFDPNVVAVFLALPDALRNEPPSSGA